MKNLVRLCLLLAVVLGQPLISAAQAPRYDAFYAFGDSLSDTGNDLLLTRLIGLDPALPPSESPHRTYFQGRFSNGPVAVEYLWRLLRQEDSAALTPILAGPNPRKKGGISFAFGGAGSGLVSQVQGQFVVPGLLGQVEEFRFSLQGKKPRPRALYSVWTGANDYISDPTADPVVVVGNITMAIERLHALGARTVIVLNLPDLGLLPLVQVQGLGPLFTQLTGAHNALLAQSLDGLAARLARVRIVRIDIFGLTQAFLASGSAIVFPPALEVLAPGASFCLFTDPSTCPDVSLDLTLPFFFWDAEHPTTFIHEVLAQEMFDTLAQ
jgi:phospholipase/lecithinase/hemolysin